MASSPSPSLSSPALGSETSHRDSSSSGGYNNIDPNAHLAQTLWSLQIPLYITHALDESKPPFIVSVPRFSYLAFLLPRLTTYFGLPCSSFHHEEVQLRNLAVGLLVDLYQPSLPWKLVVADGPEWDIADTFTNSVKEADFVRNGNAKQIMSMSKENSTALWNAVLDSACCSDPMSLLVRG